MATQFQKQMEHIGETSGAANHDHDLIHELSKRLDSLWRYDQYIANARGHDSLAKFWSEIKSQETKNIDRLKGLVRGEVEKNCF